MQDAIHDKFTIKWDFPDPCGRGGTTTTGVVAKDLLLNAERRYKDVNFEIFQDFIVINNEIT